MPRRHDPRLLITISVALVVLITTPLALAQAPAPQVPLAGKTLPQFVDPLPIPQIINLADPNSGYDPNAEIQLSMEEFKTKVLPSTFVYANLQPYTGTTIWGYRHANDGGSARQTYLGPVIIAKRGVPTRVRFINNLGTAANSKLRAYTDSIDRTIHWADPENHGANDCAMHGMMAPMGTPPSPECTQKFTGSIPAVAHLHGGEVPSEVDGGPHAWFTSDGTAKGEGYYSAPGANSNEAIYVYPNTQEAAPIWFHDHTLGATRLNVYAGLAGGYLIVDPANDPQNLPAPIPLVIQDRSFDANGELFYPAGIPHISNPEHPYWVPEFVGDTIAVNGKVWPFFNVEPRRYRFIIINGSNARTYELSLQTQNGTLLPPPIWQIGTDGGYLEFPVGIDLANTKPQVQRLTVMPGERADIIIDFGAVPPGTNFTLRNSARTPYPAGETVQGSTTARVMQFRVTPCAGGNCPADTTYNPTTAGRLRTIQRLVNPATGTLAAGVTATKTRRLTLNEVMGMPMVVNGIAYPGGPLEVLLNNSSFHSDATERPTEGQTEIWEIVNITADAHPIHLHLVQFQLMNRQTFDAGKYTATYDASFPGGVYIPGYGPPMPYGDEATATVLGGNPDPAPFLKGLPTPPNFNEAGWKDTVMALPGQVTRLAVRWAPTDAPTTAAATTLSFPFDPSTGVGYVWHCHIIDHEDNDMMRATLPFMNLLFPSENRSWVKGIHY